MSREVEFGTLLVVVAQGHSVNWHWTAYDAVGEMGCSTFGRAELRQVKKDLELLLGCELENRKEGNRIVGYYPIGRATNLRVEVQR